MTKTLLSRHVLIDTEETFEQEREYIIFADESVRKGVRFGNFYGGLIVGASQYERVTRLLNGIKEGMLLHSEIKWEKVTEAYLEKYKAVIKALFRQVRDGNVRVRVMFQKRSVKRTDLSNEQSDSEYEILYYQFLKHAFGLSDAPLSGETVRLRFYLDRLPVAREARERFKGFLAALSLSPAWRRRGLLLERENIVEVESHDHVLLQAVDLIMGAMAFKLNHMHKQKCDATGRRGKRTKAKEKLYKFILAEIYEIRPRFNIGTSTVGYGEERWSMPYRHWSFISRSPQEIKREAHLS